jgi:branched-chain amino acid transport system ATP-binding protein
MLTVTDLSAWRGRTRVLFDVSFEIEEGETLALVGANGAGKTSTMAAIMGDIRSQGTVTLGGQPIDGWSTFQRARAGLSLVPEGRRLFPQMTVYENLVVGVSRGELERLDRVIAVFPRLAPRLSQPISNLSGGEQQMVAIGRALMAQPRLLLLDEPSLGLSPIMVQAMFRAIRDVNAAGTGVLLVEQNVAMALDIADRAYLLEEGRVVAEGSADDVFNSPKLRRAYLGELSEP